MRNNNSVLQATDLRSAHEGTADTLKPWRVTLHEEAGDTFPLVFNCMAEDAEHAKEQAKNAYPSSTIVSCLECAQVQAEVLPGATRHEVVEINMLDLVDDYDDPASVPEWAWIEKVASYAHVQNGQHGVWEFILNLGNGWDDMPALLAPVIAKARNEGAAYLVVHQGT